ncbi:fatty acid desaturase-domain-containing protein [Penicillium atrosanguineum]|nr:fatty acid desaturase-domain-containing protein [Penicillium atrosanguineum]
MQTTTKLLTSPSFTLAAVEPAPSGQDQFQKALGVANKYRSRDGRKALQAIATNYIVIGIFIYASEYASSSSLYFISSSKYLIYISACLIIASRLRAFENLVHEASHYNLFSSREAHYSYQFLYSFPVLRVLEDYRTSHLIHHQHLGDATKDPDLIRILEIGLHKANERPLYYILALPFSGYVHYESLTYDISRLLHLLLLLSVQNYLLVPFFGVLPILRYWAEVAEHLGMDMASKFGHSRNNLGFGHLWYMHPHNDGYHAVHHIHSQVPFHQLPEAHAALMRENEGFRKEAVISRGIGETF